MRGLLCSISVLVSAASFAQPQAFRMPIRHADPWAVKAMMEGQSLTSPELSLVMALSGNSNSKTSGGKPLFASGRLVVNSADNNLWWFPDRSE